MPAGNLRKLAREHKPDILFLSETLSHARHLEPIRVTLGYDSCLAIDVEGQSGGLAVFWKDNSKCSVLNYSRNFINMLVEDEQKGEWRLTCYYGYPERSRRRHAWNLLRELVNVSPVPWCIIGDFNDLLSQEDKKGIHPHPNWLCMGFRQAIADCNLIDIPLAGHPFTWIKSRGTPHVIEERLDRAMASTSWLHLFPDVRLSNLLASHSDHSPILLQCSPTITVRFNGSFRFENKWLKEPDLEETVIDGWGANDNVAIVDRVARCANKLQRWGKRKRVKFKQEIEECVREMEALRDNQGEVESGRFQECSNKHATLLVQEEGYWKQRAKMHWLQEGDLNTRFFHMSASARSKKKKITNLMDDAAQADLAGILGVRHVLGTGIYLGLPSMVGRSKKAIFSYIKDRIWKRINSWKGRALSKAGKEIMIKSVLQAIPAYVMSMFILPSSFIDDIEKMINAFWWGGGNGNSKGIHWLAWERLACPKDKGGLGFRNFEAFNMAMVAKQAWKILQNPDTLVARLIKARYFPRSTLLEASLGYNPSFAWRSIWKARQVLLLGCRWRIGGGDKIHVMSDPWLRGNGERWIPSPQPEGMYNLFVRDLMVDNYKAWNVSKIRMLFPVQVAERIIATPLIGSVYVDKMVWEEERNGCYSVKSGYKLAMKCIFRNDKYHVKGNWKEIWKAHAPHKARHLLWRLCRGCIPTRRRLLERHVDCDVHCPLCEDEVEDDVHAFFTCASAQSSWQAAGLSSVLGSAACQQGSAADRVFAVCRNEDYATIGRVAMLLWSIWQNRNDKIWNDNLRSPIQVGRAAFDQWNEWIAVHKLRSNDDQDDPPVSTIRWEKPRIGWLKCNVDAAFFVSAGRTAMGACFRNNSGEFMAGITQWQQMTLSTDEGEAWALLQAMNEAKSRGFESVQFESDSQVLVDAIHTKRRGNSEFLSIVNEIILVMLSCVNFEVKFIRRQVNSVAHNLARAANSWTSFHRFEIIPSCIELLIINEMQ
ncbi:unnamed protein product [Trifolium pratense]|uniref:Uncharacterized protein n=1 Tax=Trifolium pratense TaxID=57577 RepID=A0ACB0LMY0_TRIPR|nr:unnamed protein product [Trifolium pratense]